MNARQKAKHYKQLYERLRVQNINPTVVYRSPLIEYKVTKSIVFPVEYGPNAIRHRMARGISEELIGLIDKNMEMKEGYDFEGNKEARATFTLWV